MIKEGIDKYYMDIAHNIYTGQTVVGGRRWPWRDYLHLLNQKEPVFNQEEGFYRSVAAAMYLHGLGAIERTGPTGPLLRDAVVEYCKSKYDVKQPTQPPAQETPPEPQTLQDLFYEKEGWELYVNVLKQTVPAILDTNGQFIKRWGAKGVIGNYFKWLKEAGIINYESRQELARVLNDTFKGLCMHADGGSIKEESKQFLRIIEQIEAIRSKGAN